VRCIKPIQPIQSHYHLWSIYHNSAQNRMSAFRRPTLPTLYHRQTKNDIEMQMESSDRELDTQRLRLLQVMFGQGCDQASTTRLSAYFCFLENQINVSGQKRLAPLLSLAGFCGQNTLEDSLHVVADVATVVMDDNNPSRSIHSILQSLLRQYEPTDISLDDLTRNSCWQAIFTILCWLTALIKPDATNREESFKLLESHVILSAKRPFTSLLHSLGDILPKLTDMDKESLRSSGEYSSQIYVSSINYWSLCTFGKVQIQWTDSLSAHLYFDQSSRSLSLFRFPGFCALNLETKNATPLFKR
jgi:hypothetical protein